MRRRRGGMAPFTVGLIALVVIVVGCYLGFTKSIPFRSHFEIQAAFNSSNNIKPNSPVRIAGVEVGKVTKVEPTAKGAASARITMELKDMGRPIHADAQAKIRPRIFLEGNFFIDLTSGSPGAPVLEDGDVIPASQTSTPVQFDQVLKALKAPTREAAQQTLGELANAYDAGFAKEFNRSLEDQAPAFKFSAIVSEALLGRRPHDLSDIVRDVGTASAGLDRSPPRLKAFIENFDRFAASLASERANLQATLSELPRTLEAAGPAFDSLNAAFPSVRSFAVAALPGVRSSGPAIAALRPFVSQLRGLASQQELRGLTSDLVAATPGLVQLSTGSVPLLGQLRPLASCLNGVVLPWANDTVPDKNFPAAGPVYQTSVKWLPGLAGESRSGDANGPWFKVLGTGGTETVQLGQGLFGNPIFPLIGVNPPKPKSRPPLRPDVPCETQQTPDLRTVPGDPPPTVKTDRTSPEAKLRYAKARETAILSLRNQLAKSGIKTPVLDSDATLEQIQALARKAGNAGQLEALRKGLPLTSRNIKAAGK
jgi:phospholipid/cholesterol/gamma-HCH transport system substrate-binding protein